MASKSDGKTLMKFPPERIGHVAVCADKYMVVWGGYNVGSGFILNTVFFFLSRSKLTFTFAEEPKQKEVVERSISFALQDDFNPPYTEKYLPANEIWIYHTEFKVWSVYIHGILSDYQTITQALRCIIFWLSLIYRQIL